ncbi:hypothetical protein BDB13_6441 [Rhodococcus sp. OK302]|nr:hypothetical protein BDB13_6441 [Rhodococcus sp. OK302]
MLHSIFVVWHTFTHDAFYRDLGNYFPKGTDLSMHPLQYLLAGDETVHLKLARAALPVRLLRNFTAFPAAPTQALGAQMALSS